MISYKELGLATPTLSILKLNSSLPMQLIDQVVILAFNNFLVHLPNATRIYTHNDITTPL